MKSFIVFTALIAGIAAKAAVGTDTTNFNSFEVKERDFADTYGAPAAPVESSWVADPAWSNNIAGDATFNGGNNVGVGVGINGNLGYSSGGAVSSGIGGFGMNLLTGVLVILAIAQVVKAGIVLFDTKKGLLGDLFGDDGTKDGARYFSPSNIEYALNQINDFAKKYQ